MPLMVAGTYTPLVDDTVRTGNAQADIVAETAKKAAAQAERASQKTVENHCAWAMERIGAKSLAESVRVALKLERRP